MTINQSNVLDYDYVLKVNKRDRVTKNTVNSVYTGNVYTGISRTDSCAPFVSYENSLFIPDSLINFPYTGHRELYQPVRYKQSWLYVIIIWKWFVETRINLCLPKLACLTKSYQWGDTLHSIHKLKAMNCTEGYSAYYGTIKRICFRLFFTLPLIVLLCKKYSILHKRLI